MPVFLVRFFSTRETKKDELLLNKKVFFFFDITEHCLFGHTCI